ncbi:class I SAM-dependent methyltransferase [Paradesertivirga mongoliensis]|uniref:Class I SAM-dependent methyltransferase n=1 Tax=Paradesertivirga mongoliensis TaxID=2100740 RepID=A0ABW4ZNJ5_9SPHI|nr:class I SAM-dependent methyltransferase [Pedobacter mongoliensis]
MRKKDIDLNQVIYDCIRTLNQNTNKIGYDVLDEFINGLICTDDPPEARLSLKEGMVQYQKTPARIILELVSIVQNRQIKKFVDLGSGLGQPVILFTLLTGTRCFAIEYEPTYREYAKRCASQLGIDTVTFINVDARNLDYPDNAVFYIYTSLEGILLEEILKKIERKSLHMPISLFTYAPCSSVIAKKSWLHCSNGNPIDPHSLCEFTSLPPLYL